MLTFLSDDLFDQVTAKVERDGTTKQHVVTKLLTAYAKGDLKLG